MKKILSKLVCFAVLLSVFASSFAFIGAAALDYPELKIDKTAKGNLKDYWGSVNYSLALNRDYKIKINYTSSVNSEIAVRDSRFNKIVHANDTKKYSKTIFMKKGSYTVSIYNCTFKEGRYSLKASDITDYAEKISFYNLKYYLGVGKSVVLPIKCVPEGTQTGDIKWTSSNSRIATVDSQGIVKGKALGAVTVTAKLNNGAKATATVCVNSKSYTIKKGRSRTLSRINLKSVSWKNNKPKIVSIKNGKFKGKAVGSATLTKTVNENKYTVYIKVK